MKNYQLKNKKIPMNLRSKNLISGPILTFPVPLKQKLPVICH